MGKIKIGHLQFFALTVLFELGTSLALNLGYPTGNAAWVSILLGCLAGVVAFIGYIYLYRMYPDEPLSGYARKLLGKYPGGIVAVMYIVLFINLASRNLRDGSTMLAISTMHRTPLFFLSALMIISCAYMMHKGVEVLARTSQLFVMFVAIVGVFYTILLFFSDAVQLSRLRPVFVDGLKTVLMTVVRQEYMFPFGEMISFTMLMPFMLDSKKGPRMIIAGMLVSGLLLSYTTALNLSVLGSDIVERSPLPIMSTVSKVSISDFIQRVDVLAVMVLIIGIFFKISVFYAAALVGISELFGLPYRKMVYPSALIILFSSMLDARSFIEHLDQGERLLYTVYPVFTIGIPVLLIASSLIRNHRSASREG
ncbi:Spore germination protein YndE [compost metagenome]